MKALHILFLLLVSVGVLFAARPDEEAIAFGVSNSCIVVSAVLGPSASGGGGVTSTLKICSIFFGGELLKDRESIIVGWQDEKDANRVLDLSGFGKCFLWFLVPDPTPYANSHAYVEMGGRYPLIEATEKNIAFLKSLLINKESCPKVVEPPNGLEAILQKLNAIKLPQIDFRDALLVDVVTSLCEQSRKLDPNKEGVNIVLGAGISAVKVPDGTARLRRVTIRLYNISMLEALRLIAPLVGLQFHLTPNRIELLPLDVPPPPPSRGAHNLFTTTYFSRQTDSLARSLREFDKTQSLHPLQDCLSTMRHIDAIECRNSHPHRKEHTTVWLEFLSALEQSIDPILAEPHPQAFLNLVPPPDGEGGIVYPSGVAPWVLKDLKARTEYVAAIRANAERANIGNKIISAQNDLRSLRSIVVWELRCYLERAYTFSELDRQEWSDILSRSALPEARQKEFNDLFHKKNP